MNPEPGEVYVPARRPAEAARTAAGEVDWPRPVFTPGAGGSGPTLADRVREALGPEPHRSGWVGPLFRAPEVAREVIERLGREARDHGCTAIAATQPDGLVGAPVALEAGLPLVLRDGAGEEAEEGGPAGPPGRVPGGEDAAGGTIGSGDRVLLVGGVADAGERLSGAADRVEAAGARVVAVATVVEVAGGGARDRLDGHNFVSLLVI